MFNIDGALHTLYAGNVCIPKHSICLYSKTQHLYNVHHLRTV